MLLVVIDVRSLFKFVPANCSARIFKPFSSGLISLLTLTSWPLRHSPQVRPSSSGCQIWVLVRQWILPLDSQITRSMSGVACGCSAGGFAFAMGPASPRICPRETDRGPDTFPVSNMKICQTYCHMEGVTQERVLNPLNAEILEGQVALVHHIMAFEEANPAVHILAPRQKWKATFLAYFLGAVSHGQLTIMKQLGDEAYAAGLADQNCWQVRTSKRLIYLLRHSKDTSLGRYNDALFENIDRDLQAFRWAPHQILGFLLGNTKSRFTVHVQLRRLDYMMCLPSIGASACRPCKATRECPTLLILRLLESPSLWTVAELLDTSFMQPTTKTGKA